MIGVRPPSAPPWRPRRVVRAGSGSSTAGAIFAEVSRSGPAEDAERTAREGRHPWLGLACKPGREPAHRSPSFLGDALRRLPVSIFPGHARLSALVTPRVLTWHRQLPRPCGIGALFQPVEATRGAIVKEPIGISIGRLWRGGGLVLIGWHECARRPSRHRGMQVIRADPLGTALRGRPAPAPFPTAL